MAAQILAEKGQPFGHAGQSLRRKRPSRTALALLACLALLAFWSYGPQQYTDFTTSRSCRNLPGAQDAVLIMKTGVTELEDRLPVHLETTLQCPPNVVIFSDHEELYQDKWEIRDVLANVDPDILANNDDFALYRHVKAVGRQGLAPADITGERGSSKTTKEDKIQIAGWVLDKWKFLPMMNETYHLHPDRKWYVFMETDTFLFWSTTLKYLSTLDHTEPHCLGHRSTVKSEFPFMHGGSGYILSNTALRMAVDYINAHRQELDRFVDSEWAGDIALGVVFKDAGVPLTATWPMYQPHFFGVIDFGVSYEGKDFWCYAGASYHHMTPDAIADLWSFEQKWIKTTNRKNDPYSLIRHGDIFNDFMLPDMRIPRYDWDNQCTTIVEDADKAEDCRQACIDDERCLQYAFDTKLLTCKTLDSPRYGEASLGSGIYSDWIFDRLEEWRDELPACHGEAFVMPDEYYM